jgi:hypothetical protein
MNLGRLLSRTTGWQLVMPGDPVLPIHEPEDARLLRPSTPKDDEDSALLRPASQSHTPEAELLRAVPTANAEKRAGIDDA